MKQAQTLLHSLSEKLRATCRDEKRRVNLLLAAGLGGMLLLLVSEWFPEEAAVRAAGRVSGFLAGEGLARQRLIINMIPRVFIPSPAIRDLDDVIDLVGARLIGALPREEAPPLPPGRSGTAARQEMDNIAGRLLGEEPELLYQT